MKKLLISFSAITTMSGVTASTMVGCGAEAGPTVETYIYPTTDTTGPGAVKYNTSGSNYRGQTMFKESKFTYGYADMNHNLMLPALTILNLTPDSQESGAKFNQQAYDNAIEGSATKQKVAGIEGSDPGKYGDWQDLWKQYSTSSDTYFTSITASPALVVSPDPNVTTYQNLALVPYYKDLLNLNYYVPNGTTDASRFSITNAGANIVTFAAVQNALNYLNNVGRTDPKTRYINPAVINGSPDKKYDEVSQQARHALLYIGNVEYKAVYQAANGDKFTIPFVIENLCARLDLVDYGLAISGGSKLTYYQGWVFRGYDYFSQTNLDNNYVNSQDHQVNKIINVVPGNNNKPLYIGFHDDKSKNPTDPADSKKSDKSGFPDQTTSKSSINYPELLMTILVADIEKN